MTSRPRIAVLADADQHLASLRAIREAAAREGVVDPAEAYALWKTSAREGWEKFAVRSGFDAISPEEEGKNAADRAIHARVEALLEQGEIDEFWIASSDLDLAATADLITNAGKKVRIVLSTARFPRALRSNLILVDAWPDLPADWQKEILDILRDPLAACAPYERGVLLSELETMVKRHHPSFSTRDFGSSTLLELLEGMPASFRIEKSPQGGAVHVQAL